MKKSNIISLTFLAALILSFYACKKVKTLSEVKFTYVYSIDTLPVAALPKSNDKDICSQAISTNITNILSENGVSMEHFNSARLKYLTVELIDTSTIYPHMTFNNLSRLEVYIKADGKTKKLTAGKEPIPVGVNALTFDIYNAELIDYFKKDSITLIFNATIDYSTNHSVLLHPVMKAEFAGDVWK